MPDITPQKVVLEGLKFTTTAADAGGDRYKNNQRTALYVDNGGAGPHTITIDSVGLSSHGKDNDIVLAIAAGEKVMFPFLNAERFNDTKKLDGFVAFSFDSVEAGLVVAALDFSP